MKNKIPKTLRVKKLWSYDEQWFKFLKQYNCRLEIRKKNTYYCRMENNLLKNIISMIKGQRSNINSDSTK